MKTIDYSRYRIVEAIAEQWAAGDSVDTIAENYFGDWLNTDSRTGRYLVELIVAAHDRKGRYEPGGR